MIQPTFRWRGAIISVPEGTVKRVGHKRLVATNYRAEPPNDSEFHVHSDSSTHGLHSCFTRGQDELFWVLYVICVQQVDGDPEFHFPICRFFSHRVQDL